MEPLYVGQDMVQVISRIRPLSTREKILLEEQTEIPSNRYIPFNISDNTIEVLTEEGKAKLFNFDYAYGPEATQETIFERSIGPMLEQSLEKSNGLAIFVYGATGSGRRFTLGGVPECPGILPRIFRALFDFKKGFLGAKMSCIEIYNEYVKDLTVDFKAGHDLKIKESKEKGVYIEGLNETPVNSAEECISLLAISNKNHAIAATCMGMSTTRSNVIYTIEGVTGEGIAKKIHMVRLAGTERIPKTSATGERLVEASKINRSLCSFEKVITCLTDAEKYHFIPYRDSKLTRLLQNVFTSRAHLCFILTLSPSIHSLQTSLATFQFGITAKKLNNVLLSKGYSQ